MFAKKSARFKRTFKRFLFDCFSYRNLLQDKQYEQKICQVYTLFVYIDLYALQKEIDFAGFRKLPAYVYLLYRSIRNLNALNKKLRSAITLLTDSRMQEGYIVEKRREQAYLEQIAISKLECLRKVDSYLAEIHNLLLCLLEIVDEKYDY